MDKGDAVPARTDAGCVVDQPIPGAAAGCQRGIEIGHPVADVMDSWATPSDEPVDGRVGNDRSEQLHIHIAEGYGNYFRPIGGFHSGGREAQNVAIERDSGLEVLNGHADVGDTDRMVGHGSSNMFDDDAPAVRGS
jgi:hypothetical protein